MATDILIKRSSTPGAVPTTGDLSTGELAINTADKRLFTNNAGTIVEIGTAPSTQAIAGNATVGGTLGVTGNTTLSGTLSAGATTLASGSVSGNFSVTGTLTVGTPTGSTDAASKGYVDAQVSALIDSAPGALDTLNELAAAINDDANFATTVTNALAGKLALTGGTMTGDITMGANKITSTATPATDDTLTRKGYVDSILGSATSAADSATAASGFADNAAASASAASTSASNASTSATNAGTSASNASDSATAASNSATSASNSATASANSATASANSATAAATSATNAENAYDSFDDRYLGDKASAPTVDNDGDALVTGALYFDTTLNQMRVFDGTSFIAVGSSVNGTAQRYKYTATAAQTSFSGTDDNGVTLAYDPGYIDVYLNGVHLDPSDYTATSGTSIVLDVGAALNDELYIVAFGNFQVADTVSKADGGTFDSAVTFGSGANTDTISEKTAAAGVTIDGVLLKDDDVTATDGSFSGDMKFNSGFGSVATAYGCRAWVNFKGTDTVEIREDGNVSSITDNGTGDYTVNFTTAMPDANYAFSGATGRSGAGARFVSIDSNTNLSNSSFRCNVFDDAGTEQDDFYVLLQVVR